MNQEIKSILKNDTINYKIFLYPSRINTNVCFVFEEENQDHHIIIDREDVLTYNEAVGFFSEDYEILKKHPGPYKPYKYCISILKDNIDGNKEHT